MLTVLVMVGCGDAPTAVPGAEGPEMAMSKVATGGGIVTNGKFAFLSAGAPQAGKSRGALAQAADPVVEFCVAVRGECASSLGSVSRRESSSHGEVTLDAANGRYVARHVLPAGHTPNQRYIARVLLGGFEVGRTEVSASRGQTSLEVPFHIGAGFRIVRADLGQKVKPMSQRYKDKGRKPGRGRSGGAAIEVQALSNTDGTTDLELTTGAFDGTAAPTGLIERVTLTVFASDGSVAFKVTLAPSTPTATWTTAVPGLIAGATYSVDVAVRTSAPPRIGHVTATGVVGRRPDLEVVKVFLPATVTRGTPVAVHALVRERVGDLGVSADCVLLVDGVEKDRIRGVWVDAGDQVRCSMETTFTGQGFEGSLHDVVVRLEGMSPRDGNPLNDSRATRTLAGGWVQRMSGLGFFHQHEEDSHALYNSVVKTWPDVNDADTYTVQTTESEYRFDGSYSYMQARIDGDYWPLNFPLLRLTFRLWTDGGLDEKADFVNVAASHWTESEMHSSGCGQAHSSTRHGSLSIELCSLAHYGGVVWSFWTDGLLEWSGGHVVTYLSRQHRHTLYMPSGHEDTDGWEHIGGPSGAPVPKVIGDINIEMAAIPTPREYVYEGRPDAMLLRARGTLDYTQTDVWDSWDEPECYQGTWIQFGRRTDTDSCQRRRATETQKMYTILGYHYP